MRVPPPAFSVRVRLLVKPARNCSVPPLKVRPLLVAPRLVSEEIGSVPWLMVQGVTAAVVPVSVQAESPTFRKDFEPPILLARTN